jgi:tetratricopeptide (TPR) repeat protein
VRIAFSDFHGLDFHARSVDLQPLGGSHSAASYLARALAERGDDVYLFSHTATTPVAFAGVKCLSWNSTPLSALGALQFDVFVCLLGAGGAMELRAALGPKAPLVLWTQHRVDQPSVQALHHAEVRGAFDGFVFVSNWQREEYLRLFQLDPARAHVLRNAVAPAFENLFPEDAPILPEKARPPVIAYTSTPYRGLDLLLEVFPALRAAVPGVRLRVFSSMKVYQIPDEADQATYGELYQRCRETPGVEYAGSVPQPILARELRSVMALAYPNTFAETSCIAALEAMASGCAVVTTALGALPETTAGFARLVPFGQERPSYLSQFLEHLTDVLRAGMANDAQTETLLRRQVSSIRSNATWRIRAAQWHEWLEQLPSRRENFVDSIPQAATINSAAVSQHFDRGNVLSAAGRFDEAITAYRQALQIDPNCVDAQYNLGNALLNQGRLDEAISAYRAVLQRAPHLAVVHTNLGSALNAKGLLDEAVAAYRRALQFKPDSAAALNNLGLALREKGQFEDAISAFRHALRIKPDHADLWHNLGLALESNGMLDEAIDGYRRALQIKPDHAKARQGLELALTRKA